MSINTKDQLLEVVDTKKKLLDSYRPLPKEVIRNLNEWYRVHLTYTSNALEGNSLTASETASVLEKGITAAGKPLKDHLEAINHAFAFDYIISLAEKTRSEITLLDMYAIHQLILKGIDSENAGQLRKIAVRITGLDMSLPEPYQLVALMDDYISWLHGTQDHPVIVAADAHYKLVTIHPFIDGNGRSARLLMNLLLIQPGYPPVIIAPEDRVAYLDALSRGQLTGDILPFQIFILHAIEKSFDVYLESAQQSLV